MSVVRFSVWDGNVIDNRAKRLFEIEEIPELANFDVFNPGNAIRAFFGGKGFFVFDSSINILDAVIQYFERASTESCGRCTPCRVGLRIISEKLLELATTLQQNNRDAAETLIEEIRILAEQVKVTSLCGLGQTSPVALIELIDHFRDEITNCTTIPEKQPTITYVTAPCIEACPSKVQVPKYIDYIKNGNFTHSVGVVLQKYPMAATCGRVCVRFCELACQRTQVDEAVGIKVLKRFVADKERYVTDNWFIKELISDKKHPDLKVAVIGSGPSGISAAYHLLLKGYTVDVYEAMTEPGGMAAVGIPEYRLPRNILQKEVSIIESLGGKIIYNQRMGEHYNIQTLHEKGYKAIFLGIGAHEGKTLGIPGESRSLQGYVTGVKFLLFINHYYINMNLSIDLGERVVVVGGGNVAMDCARSALRMGVKEVHLIYRRSKNEMPADHEEIEAAEKEGIIFHFLTHPTHIINENGKVTGIELIKMKLGQPDESGRRSVKPIDGSEQILEANFVIPAIGQAVDHSFLSEDDRLEFDRWGMIATNPDTLMTSRRGIFAGGDCVTGPATLIEAMSQGEHAAKSIDDYLTYGRVRFSQERRMSQLLKSIKQMDYHGVKVPMIPQYRVKIQELDPNIRRRLFEEVEKPITVEEAYKEANRCMRCYRVYSVVTEK